MSAHRRRHTRNEPGPAHYPENLWPELPAGFRDNVGTWFTHAGALARHLTRIFEVALDLPAQYFAPFQDHSVDVLRLNRCAMPANASRAVTDQMGMGAHTDYGIVTVLSADQVVPGLQILGACRTFISVNLDYAGLH